MTRSIFHKIILVIGLLGGGLLSPIASWAQSDSQNLIRARERFDNGQFFQAIRIVHRDVLGYKPKKGEKAGSYRLLTEIYLVLGRRDSADKYMKLYLKNARGLQMDDSNPDLYHQYRSFRTDPLLFISPKLGLNSTQIIPYERLGTDYTSNTGINDSSRYLPTYLAPHAGLGLSLGISRTVELGLEAIMATREYSYEEALNFNALGARSVHQLSFTENHLWLDMPVWISYTYRQKYKPNHPQKVFPYLNAGVTYSRLLQATFGVIRRESEQPEGGPPFIAETSNFPLLSSGLRNRNSLAVSAGGGMKFKVKNNYLALDFRYNLGFINLVNPENRFANQDLVFKFGHVDNDIRMNQYALSLSYVIPIYNYKKRKAYELPDMTDYPELANLGADNVAVIEFEDASKKKKNEGLYEIVWERGREVLAYSNTQFGDWDTARNNFPKFAQFPWHDEGRYVIQRDKGMYFLNLLDGNDKIIARSEKTFVDRFGAELERDRLMQMSPIMPKNFTIKEEDRHYILSLLNGQGQRIGKYVRTFDSFREAASMKEKLSSLNPINTDLNKETNVFVVSLKTNKSNDSLVFIPTFATEKSARGFIARQSVELGLPLDNFSYTKIRNPFEVLIRDGSGHDLFTIYERYGLEANSRQLKTEVEKIAQWQIKSDRIRIDTVAALYRVYLRNPEGDSIAEFKNTYANEREARAFMDALSVYHMGVRRVNLNRPVRTPTAAELERAAMIWIGKEVSKYLDANPEPVEPESLSEEMGKLIQIINQELDRLAAEKKDLTKSLRKGPLRQIETDIDTLEDWRKKLKNKRKQVRKDADN